MATYKVDELEAGPLLDAAVAQALGLEWRLLETPARPVAGAEKVRGCWVGPSGAHRPFHPSRDTQGDEIIDRERIATMVLNGQWRAWMPEESRGVRTYDPEDGLFEMRADEAHGSGPTRRVAAMRAFVKRRFNSDTVDL